MNLYHFSDRGDIEVFVPRAPLRHPDSEPLVYAMDEANMPLYFFPRDCPRIVTWVTDETSDEDRQSFGRTKFRAYIDRSCEESWRTGHVYRYVFDPDGFEPGHGYGDWISRSVRTPLRVELLDDLPSAAEQHGMSVEIVDSLVDLGHELYDYEAKLWTTTLHVSMVRMGLLPGWDQAPSKPTWNKL